MSTDGGFTAHEHLDNFGLINMNGRVYDPMLGMFLSPDNYVQWPGYTQNYNRYGYALNNPLVYTDPSGYKFKLWKALLFAPFGLAAISPGTKYASGEASLGQAVGEYVVNAAAFIAGGSIGVSIPGIDGAILGGMASGAISGGGMVAVNGGNFEDIIGGIAMGANIGALAGAVSYGVITGLGAAANGIGKSLVQGNGNLAANVSRWGNTTTGWLQLSSTSGFSYIAGNGIQSNLIPNIAMSINGALAGSWGSKLIPAGRSGFSYTRITDENRGIAYASIEDAYNLQQLRKHTGSIYTKINSVSYTNQVFGSSSDFIRMASGDNQGIIAGTGQIDHLTVDRNVFMRKALLSPGSIGELYVYGRSHKLYGRDIPYPWWIKTFFGVGR